MASFARLTDMLPSEQGWRPLDYEIETAWLRDRTPASGPNSAGSTTGYEPDGYEHAIWILHAMYEPIDPKPSTAEAYDREGPRGEVAAGATTPGAPARCRLLSTPSLSRRGCVAGIQQWFLGCGSSRELVVVGFG